MRVRLHILLAAFVLTAIMFSCASTSTPVAVTFSINEHDFGSVNIADSVKFDFFISNKKNAILTLTRMTVTNFEFLVVAGGTPNTRVQAKTDHLVTIQFFPALPGGIKNTILKIEYNYGVGPLFKEISLTGNAIPVAKIDVNPKSNDFQAIVINTTKTKNFLISNIGTANLNVFGLALTGANAGDFTITTGAGGALITPLNSTTFTIEFAPTVVGNKNAILQISHDGKNLPSPIDVNLEGSGYDVPVFSIVPASPFDFGKVAKGDTKTETFTITNLGGDDMNATSVSVSGDFSIKSGGAPFNITPGNTHDIDIEFAPTGYGLKQQVVSFRSNTLTSPDSITVKGEGFRGLPFEENFDNVANGQLPTLWTITRDTGSNTAGTQWNWQVNAGSFRPNKTGGSSKFITADSEHFLSARFKDYLTTPAIDCSLYTTGTVTLEFDGNFQSFLNYDTAKVEVYDGAAWQVVGSWNDTWATIGEHKNFDITQHALRNSELKVRFYYENAYLFMYFFQIDNVEITRQ